MDLRKLSPSDIVKFIESGAKLEVQALGQVADLRGVFMIRPSEVTKMVGVIVDTALTYIVPERQEAFLLHAAAATSGEQLPRLTHPVEDLFAPSFQLGAVAFVKVEVVSLRASNPTPSSAPLAEVRPERLDGRSVRVSSWWA